MGERWRILGYPAFQADIRLPKNPHALSRTEGSVGGVEYAGQTPRVQFETGDRPRPLYINKRREQSEKKGYQGHYGGNKPHQHQTPYPHGQGQGGSSTPFTGPYGPTVKHHKGQNSGENGFCTTTLGTIFEPSPVDDYLPIRVFLTQQVPRNLAEARHHVASTVAPPNSVTAKALMDTGSLGGDFLSGDMLRRLQGGKYVYRTTATIVVCSGLDNACYPTSEMIDIGVEFSTDEKINKVIFLKYRIFHLSKIDLIIGRPSIKKHRFSQINSSHLIYQYQTRHR